ncbi:MAG TPA: hypothetical protein VMG38_12690 [Trebonia sp.]|nr:hypothetical protein [Trebonia sp.]
MSRTTTTRPPWYSVVSPNAKLALWNTGSADRFAVPESVPSMAPSATACAVMLAPVSIVPLGYPVVPEV